ncbi:MAG: hypothetical protein GY949_14700 [Gammaproteobacteria bacterium]|nr:hypothetical protein [Gammaproteobacteria bacterium]
MTTARAEDGIDITYQERLEQVRLVHTTSLGEQKVSSQTVRALHFDAFGKRFDVNLDVNHSLLTAMQRELADNHFEIYRGDIAGLPNSWVRLVIADGLPRGMLWDGNELMAIEVAANEKTGVEEAFIYRLSDLQVAPGALACSEIGIAKNAGELAKAVLSEVTENAAQGPGATSQIDLAVIGDYEFTTDNGSNTSLELTTRMNNIDGIFSMQLGVQINVNQVDTFAANDDPFSDETESGALLDELTDYRFTTTAQHANGLTHLFTGRTLDGSTVGIAYSEALCSRRYGAGLTEGRHGVTMDSLIAAHEIGHNFGAPHDGTSGSACESEPQDFLMAPRLNGSDQFSACSITQMQDDVSGAPCISAMPSTDVAMVAGSQSPTALLGDATTITFEANSIGTENASGVNVDVTIPAGVALNTVSVSTGSCTSGAGTASCTIGPVTAGSGVTITLEATTEAVGNADFVASVTADTDADGGNNEATIRLVVDPAVDLVTTAATAAQVIINQSTTIRPTIENRSPIAASNVTVSIAVDAGIRVDSASWTPGSCSIANNLVTCDADSLASQASDPLQLGITGASEGSQSYTMSVVAAETDRNTSNNEASGQVTVNPEVTAPPPDNSSSGGGGSFEWLSLLFLMVTRLASMSRATRP